MSAPKKVHKAQCMNPSFAEAWIQQRIDYCMAESNKCCETNRRNRADRNENEDTEFQNNYIHRDRCFSLCGT